MRGAKPPILPGQQLGRINRRSLRIAETPRRLRAALLIRRAGARLFAEYGVGAVGAVPALAERPDLTEPLLGTLRALLDDPTTWPEPEAPADRTRRARRVTGMLIAAASAETQGAWPALGPTEAASAPPRRVECSQARARFKELLAAVSAGADVTLTRHGRPAARLVRAG